MTNATRFWLIRHGETQWNAERRLQGWLDIPLNTVGLEQASRVASHLQSADFDVDIDVVISSDLGRAYETARIAAAHLPLPIMRDKQLRERCYGIYEGRDWAMLEGEQVGSHYVNFRDPAQEVEDGETLPEFATRIARAFERLAQEHPGRNVLVFSHGGVIDIAWRQAAGVGLSAPRNGPILNASINCLAIDIDRKWHLLDWGLGSHLHAPALDDVL